ncbi:type II methionyl aminopeptidase [Candidatus Woesearchaeota archaeon]|nr:MAG: type II methionyl aminopeptidase [Candidatus Woesearchaeota archaeon]
MVSANDENKLDDWITAGKIAGQARDFGCSLVKKGASMLEVAEKIEAKIRELGGQPAFPVNISLNHVAAHHTPLPNDDSVFGDDIVKVDVGVHVNGAIGDTAATVDLSGNYSDLIKASKEALESALEIVKPGVKTGEIGKAIQEAITSYGFAPVRNLAGHGLSRYEVHDVPSIPNTDTGNQLQLKEGQIIAIEPFASTGAGVVQEGGVSSIFSQISANPVRDRMARQLLNEIKKYNNLPFASRWLTGRMSYAQVRLGLLNLTRAGVIRDYPPLSDEAKGMISQAEHTIIVLDEPVITTKTS